MKWNYVPPSLKKKVIMKQCFFFFLLLPDVSVNPFAKLDFLATGCEDL